MKAEINWLDKNNAIRDWNLLTGPILKNEFRFAISWATWLSTLSLNFTRKELVNNSFDEVDDVTRANDDNTESPKSREHHFSGIFQFNFKLLGCRCSAMILNTFLLSLSWLIYSQVIIYSCVQSRTFITRYYVVPRRHFIFNKSLRNWIENFHLDYFWWIEIVL